MPSTLALSFLLPALWVDIPHLKTALSRNVKEMNNEAKADSCSSGAPYEAEILLKITSYSWQRVQDKEVNGKRGLNRILAVRLFS